MVDPPEPLLPSSREVRDLEVLLQARHPLIVLDCDEPERSDMLVRSVADRLGIGYACWSPDDGLERPDALGLETKGTDDPLACLELILRSPTECVYHLQGFETKLDDARVRYKLVDVAHKLWGHRGAVVLSVNDFTVPAELARLATRMKLRSPTREQYYAYVKHLLRDLHARNKAQVSLSGEDVSRLLDQLQGLSFLEVKKVLTRIFVEEQGLDAADIVKIGAAKREIIERSGLLEYYTPEEALGDVAGLHNLKRWLLQRKAAFSEPDRARSFGLTPPKGLLLIGVQGCGKSLSAKVIAHEWGLPLIRLDPSRLYDKYFGESERNLRRAIETAETMAPVVLWIDELEKAFTHGGTADDSGTSARIFGSFLTWLQHKKPGVFIVATCNDIDKLPPELVRKGRFDDIFFVDLPDAPTREAILAVHLRHRNRNPGHFDLPGLAARTEGWSGAEIEQLVISALYSGFAQDKELDTAMLAEEVARTVPLSTTAREKIAALRSFAHGRAVPAS